MEKSLYPAGYAGIPGIMAMKISGISDKASGIAQIAGVMLSVIKGAAVSFFLRLSLFVRILCL
ncbi:hypothetical protein EPIR_0127 [Erwinia piriflorinigrans CFBP 5888]|uniref:Uncharacterized protein n=1 Tax=Erwinia piriflorinigrans CFBP 5888 TaxID=1161919 RepID=V5Z2S6_9GAMM|nr:hypothetical protein EPIR_0127 [Erwinia piriflorinigrans CFBP 5888]